MRILVNRSEFLQALRQLRPWVKKDRSRPLRSAIRLRSANGNLELLAGSARGQGRKVVSAQVEYPGTAVVDTFGLQTFARYADADELTLLATDEYLLCRAESEIQQVAAFRQFPKDQFPDLDHEGLMREHLRADMLPDRNEVRLFEVELPASHLACLCRFFDFATIHPQRDLSDALRLHTAPRRRDQLHWIAGYPDLLLLYRQDVPNKDLPSNFQQIYSRKSWLPIGKQAEKLDPQSPVTVQGYDVHSVISMDGETDAVLPVLLDLPTPRDPKEILHALQGLKQFRGALATASEWWDFFAVLEPFVDVFPRVDIVADRHEWRISLAQEGYSVESAIRPERNPGWKPFRIEMRSQVVLAVLQRYLQADPETQLFFTYRKDSPYAFWRGQTSCGIELFAVHRMILHENPTE